MTTFPVGNLFDDFLDGVPVGPQLDALAALFSLTRNDAETDGSLLARLEATAGVVVQGAAQYFPSS